MQPPRLPCRQVRHASFNPYRVFKFVATLPSARSSCRARSVSIPIGFSSSLQRPGECDRPGSRLPVSIPIGFSSSLQLKARLVVWGDNEPGFNPYRVFKFVATRKGGRAADRVLQVSIPIGFSSSLQRQFDLGRKIGRSVSIPIGFSSSLQHNRVSSLEIWRSGFQSLSGFQVRCNIATQQKADWTIKVSIPIGFSSSLQHIRRPCRLSVGHSFNPYRVFKFVATLRTLNFRMMEKN